MLDDIVKPEFGPSLPQLLRSRSPMLRRLLLALAALPIVLVVVWGAFGRGSSISRVVIAEPIEFNFGYEAPFRREQTPRGALARVGDGRQSMTVRSLRLPPYRGDSAGFFPVYAVGLAQQMERERPGLVWRYDGRVNVNQTMGYEIGYVVRERGERIYGRRIMLLPDPTDRNGVELTLEAPADKAIVNPAAVGTTGPLKTSLRSFRFGTETP